VRSTGEGLGPAEAWHVGGALMGAVVTDEGTSDLLYVVDGELWAAVE